MFDYCLLRPIWQNLNLDVKFLFKFVLRQLFMPFLMSYALLAIAQKPKSRKSLSRKSLSRKVLLAEKQW